MRTCCQVLAPVDEFEVLMGLAAKGASVIDRPPERFTCGREGHANLNNFLDTVRRGEDVRPAALEERFQAMTEDSKRRLFAA